MIIKKVVDFIFEIGILKMESHSGLKLAGIKNPPSIAEHVMRACQIGYVLALMEGANPERVVCLVLFHDNAESRTRDLHRVAARYFPRDIKKQAEKEAYQEQIAGLGDEAETNLMSLFEEKETLEHKIAKEADELEQAFTAKEFVEQGYIGAQDWIDNAHLVLRSESAKAILTELEKSRSTDWWKNLKDKTPYFEPMKVVSG